MAKQNPLRVQETKVGGKTAYGVTDGKKWFWWAYTIKASAEKTLLNLIPEKARNVNVSHQKAYEISELTPEKIKTNPEA